MTRIQLRHDTATNWTTANPILAEGEIGVETDTNKIKIGDGVTSWSSLDYFGGDVDLSNYYNKTETDNLISDLPTGLELSISNGLLSAQPGHIKSENGVLTSTSIITTLDISSVSTAVNNGVILGNTTSWDDVSLSSDVKYIYCNASGGGQFNSMTEDAKGAWLIASSSQGTNSSSWPHYGVYFNTALPAGQYRISLSTGNTYGRVYLCSGTIGNFSVLYESNQISNPQNLEVTVSGSVSAIIWVVGNYNGFQAPYGLTLKQYVSATEFNTYLCKSSDTLSLKLSQDDSTLSSYDDYAKIGEVKYADSFTNPQANPTENITDAFLSGNLVTSDGNSVIGNLSTATKSYLYSLRQASTQTISNVITANDTPYTAPADGEIIVGGYKNTNGGDAPVLVVNDITVLRAGNYNATNVSYVTYSYKVQAGDVIKAFNFTSLDISSFRYAKGAI